ncbi:MAG: SLC13 family permease [Salinigranum sp.]
MVPGTGIPTGAALVFALVVVAVALFVTEVVSPDVTALGVVVALVVLGPWTGVSVREGLSGFSNEATLTVVAMYVLSRGVQRTGVVRRLGDVIARAAGGSERRLLAAVVGLTGPVAGIVNNTPVVAVFVPMVTDLADEAGVSPSRLLLPLSYASMLGGTLTLVGTATNLVASDISASLIGHPFSMFEFTPLGVIVLVVGWAYLLTVGRALLPARVPPGDQTSRYEIGEYLHRVAVPARSPLVHRRAAAVAAAARRDLDLDVLDVVRGGEHFVALDSDRPLEARDVLTVRGAPDAVRRFVRLVDLRLLPRATVTNEDLESPDRAALLELVVREDSSVVGQTVDEARLRERYDATVLAIRRRGGELVREGFGAIELRAGDALLLGTTDSTARYLAENRDFLVVGEPPEEVLERERAGGLSTEAVLALAIVGTVVGLAAVGAVPIVVAALGGVVAMIVTGIISTSDAYDAVDWSVVFLLAGVIPLGLAIQGTGGADLVAGALTAVAVGLPPLVVLALFSLFTGTLANVVTPVASVILLLPIAVDTAGRIGANPFAFVLAVTFAASTAFVTPVGYQTNLMVYGPGGYRFTDYVRVGAPLQLLLALVTPAAIALLWGV